MGGGESRPTYPTNEQWVEYREEKLKEIKNHIEVDETIIKDEMIRQNDNIIKRYETNQKFMITFSEYCHYCHDTPSLLMLFPNNRAKCNKARLQLLENISTIANETCDIDLHEKNIEEIKGNMRKWGKNI